MVAGFLQPLVSPAPLEGRDLLVFLQSWIVGICGLPGDMVLPRWQSEPPVIPPSGAVWAAIGIMRRPSDTFPYMSEGSNGLSIILQRQEELHMLCSFYDTGSTGDADYFAALTREGMSISQNLELLQLNGFMLGYTGELQPVPSLLAQQWLYRVDLPLVVRRQIDRVYSVPSILSADGETNTSDGLDFPITVP